jgi:hypothetical protein
VQIIGFCKKTSQIRQEEDQQEGQDERTQGQSTLQSFAVLASLTRHSNIRS